MSAIPTVTVPRGPASSLRRNPAAAWRHLDVVLLFTTLTLAALGVLMVYSATRTGDDPTASGLADTSYLKRQFLWVVAGVVLMGVVALMDYRRFRDWAPMIYGGSLLALIAVISPLGTEVRGTQAWFQIGAFQLQPAEFAKLALIVMLASLAALFNAELNAKRLLLALLLAGVPMGLILLQPDVGTALVFGAITLGMLLVGGTRPRHFVALLLVGVIGLVAVYNLGVLDEYQKRRVTAFLDQEGAPDQWRYNLDQAKIAIASGGVFGRGPFKGTQTNLDYVPEQQTDFIFTVVGEELGFVGAATLFALFGIMAWRVWRIAQLSRDLVGTLICAGVLSLLAFQLFQNVGMTMGIMPITGIPLPFVSYGGSGTLAAFAAIGLVLNVHMRRFS
jgi:rod shape determining protein RodA